VLGYLAAPTTPSTPTVVSARPGNGSAILAWAAAADGGAPITTYTVNTVGGGPSATSNGPTSAVVTGLSPGTPHTFTITATNALGSGPASAATATVTPRGPPPATLADYTLTLDPVGNPTRLLTNRTTPTGTTNSTDTYTYDPANRLTGVCYATTTCADPARAISYSYDLVGNRKTETWTGGTNPGITTSHYNDADQLTSTDGATAATYGYDLDGNETAAGPARYTYDLLNRMTTAAPTGTGGVSYGYDPDGNRLTATSGGSTTTYQWDVNHPLPQLAVERTGSTTRSYRYDADGAVLSTVTNGQLSYDSYDPFANVSDLTGTDGTPYWAYSYEPFGTVSAAVPADASLPTDPMRFAGEYQDPTTGLDNLRARQYDPAQGRFTAVDPLDAKTGDPYPAAYIYAGDQPTIATDPSGQCILGHNDDGTCRGSGLADNINQAKLGAEAAVGDAVTGLAGLAAHRNDAGYLGQAAAAIASDCLAGMASAGGGANAIGGCIAQISGINDLINGLVAAFHGCVYWGAYQATGGAIQILLSLAPFGAGKVGSEVIGSVSVDAEGAIVGRAGAAIEGAIPSTTTLADEVAAAAGGIVKTNKGGYTVDVPFGSRGIMNEGGGRTDYYRISVPGKQAYTVDGTPSTDRAETHIDISPTSWSEIMRIIQKIKRGG
jgi:RHS repeat-associated protein